MQISPLRIDYRCILQHRQTSRIPSDNIYRRPCTNSTEKMKTGDLHVSQAQERHTHYRESWDGPKGAHLFATPILSPPPTCFLPRPKPQSS